MIIYGKDQNCISDVPEHEKKKMQEYEDKSPFISFAQQNIDKADMMMKVANNSLAMKIYILIVSKMNKKNALIASYQFFIDYFKSSYSSVKRAIQLLKSESVLQVKRSGGATIYLLNPDVVWKGKRTQMQYCEFEANVVLTRKEWSDEDAEE